MPDGVAVYSVYIASALQWVILAKGYEVKIVWMNPKPPQKNDY